MPILKKLVDVEATEAEVLDYLRSLMGKALEWRPGDVVKMIAGDHEHMRRGTLSVVRGYDHKDDTVQVLYYVDNHPHSCWASTTELEMVQPLPTGWRAVEVAASALEAAQMGSRMVEESNQRTKEHSDPLRAMKRGHGGWGGGG